MRPKVSFMLVGAFVLLLGAALVAAIVWLSAAGQDRAYRPYVAYMTESVAGLSLNARVSYNGVEVGVVRAIELDHDDPTRVRLLLDIADTTPVKVDTVAKLQTSGITGVAHVELSGGSADSAMLEAEPGEEFPVIPTEPSLFVRLDSSISTLVEKLGGAADSLTQVAERVELLLDDQNREAIAQILVNVEEFTDRLDAIAIEVQQLAEQLGTASGDLPALIEETRVTVAAFQTSAQSIETAGNNISSASIALEEAAVGVAASVQDILADLTPLSRGGPARLVHLVDELQLLASTLRRLSMDVERNPEMLFFGRRDVVRGPGE